MADIEKDIKINFLGDAKSLNKDLDNIANKADKTGQKLDQAGTKGEQGLEKTNKSAKKLDISLAATSAAVFAYGQQIAGMAQKVLDFESKLIALQKTAVGMQKLEVQFRRQQEDLNQAVAEGTISTRDYERAVEDLRFTFIDMRLEQQNIKAETNKLTGEYISFGIQAVTMASSISIAMAAMGVSSKTAFASIILGIKGVSAALWTVAKHPVFLFVTAGIMAWELGLKSIVEQMTGFEDLGIFSNIQKFFENAVPNATENVSDLDKEFNQLAISTGNYSQKLDDAAFGMDKISGKSSGILALNTLYHQLAREAKAAADGIESISRAQSQVIRQSGFSSASSGGLSTMSGGSSTTPGQPQWLTALKNQVAEDDAERKRKRLFGPLNENTRRIIQNILIANREVVESRFKETDEVINAVLSNNQLSLINDYFDLAIQEASNGNIAGAINLERAAQRMGRNTGTISGFLTTSLESMMAAGRVRNSFTSASSISGLRSGVSRGTVSTFGGRSLTRSTARRRSARNRNAMGRNDKLAIKFKKSLISLNKENSDLFSFTDAGSLFSRRFQTARFGNNTSLSYSERKNIIFDQFSEYKSNILNEALRRRAVFDTVFSGATQEEGLLLLDLLGSNKQDVFSGSFGRSRVEDTINARNFFNNSGVTNDINGTHLLYEIATNGYREMDDRLAFQGRQRFNTVKT